MNTNRKAFLDMISHSEGTNYGPCDGYNILYGSTKAKPAYFLSYEDHPRKKITAAGITSTAAGRSPRAGIRPPPGRWPAATPRSPGGCSRA